MIEAVRVSRTPTNGPSVFGLPLTAQTWLLLASVVLLVSLVGVALVDWLTRA